MGAVAIQDRDDVDLAILEGEYRAGTKTLQRLADEYRIDRTTISSFAKKFGWTKDLQPAIKERTTELIRRLTPDEERNLATKSIRISDGSKNDNENHSHLVDDDAVVEAVAQSNAVVIRKGQKRIARLQGIVEGMLEELALQSLSGDDLQHMSEFVAMVQGQMTEDKVSKSEVDKRVKAFKKILALDSRADTAKKLADSLKTLIGLERQAHGIADNANGDADGADKNKDVDLTVNEAARRVAFVLLSASKKKEG